MFWSTISFKKLVLLLLPTFLRKSKTIAFVDSLISPMQDIADDTLYKMQHTGITINLEKMLNEAYNIAGYDHQNHHATKKIYIEDIPRREKLYIHTEDESAVIFLEDEDLDSENDIFVDGPQEGNIAYSFIIFMPDTVSFDEITLRAKVDFYRYFGKKYTIEIY
jgi:hypothetical protein